MSKSSKLHAPRGFAVSRSSVLQMSRARESQLRLEIVAQALLATSPGLEFDRLLRLIAHPDQRERLRNYARIALALRAKLVSMQRDKDARAGEHVQSRAYASG